MTFTRLASLWLLLSLLLSACGTFSASVVTPPPSQPASTFTQGGTATPTPPFLTWQSADSPCLAADLYMEEISYGECGGPRASVPTQMHTGRLNELVMIFASFSVTTYDGMANFTGKGTTIATVEEQRSIVEWAKSVVTAFRVQSAKPVAPPALSYHHESIGNEDVQISMSGHAVVSANGATLGQRYLTATELEQLYGFVDSLASVDSTSQPSQSPSPSTIQMSLFGAGTKQADEATIRAMAEFANQIFLSISFIESAPLEMAEAQYALHLYFGALHSGDFLLAAKLYGGDTSLLQTWNPDLPNDLPALLQRACTQNGLRCLLPRSTLYRGPDADGGYQFIAEFNNDDGTLFRQSVGEGSVTLFLYRVLKTENGYVVMDLPPYVP